MFLPHLRTQRMYTLRRSLRQVIYDQSACIITKTHAISGGMKLQIEAKGPQQTHCESDAGGDLYEELKRNKGTLGEHRVAVQIIHPCMQALAYLHEKVCDSYLLASIHLCWLKPFSHMIEDTRWSSSVWRKWSTHRRVFQSADNFLA